MPKCSAFVSTNYTTVNVSNRFAFRAANDSSFETSKGATNYYTIYHAFYSTNGKSVFYSYSCSELWTFETAFFSAFFNPYISTQ
jgi:hypothetical protein